MRIITTTVLAIASALMIQPAAADDEERRIVKKILIECDGADCEQHEAGDTEVFAWSSAEGPLHFNLRAHVGGGFLGVLLAELTPELRAHFGVKEDAGVMVSKVIDDSPASRAGLEVGDIITAVDGEAIGSGGQLAHSIRSREDGESVLLEVWRDGSVQNLTATVEEREAEPHGMDYGFVVQCDDDEQDCSFARKHLAGSHSGWGVDLDCTGDGPCEVKVDCDDDGGCDCTVNGEPTDCSELPGFDH